MNGEKMFQQLVNYFQANSAEYWLALWQHLSLSVISLVIAFIIAFPLALLSYKQDFMRYLSQVLIQSLRVIPSLGLLFILIPFIGVGILPAIIALVILGLPPILLNTVTGFSSIDDAFLEVAKGLGMSNWQMFYQVILPLSLPYVLNGVKIALIEIIASATLATYIGAGGLGSLIFTGLGLYRFDLLVIGGVSVATLSLIVMLIFDYVIRKVQKRVS